MHLVPGDPAKIIAGEGASEQTVDNIRERLQLLPQQILIRILHIM